MGFLWLEYISDSLPAQLKINTLAKQLCFAHLMRELKNFEASFDSKWVGELKQLFKKTLAYKKQISFDVYKQSNLKIEEFEKELSQLLEVNTEGKHKKEKAFIRRLIKNRKSIFTFLYFKDVPADNNGSERSIRNIKVIPIVPIPIVIGTIGIGMKISNQFKSFEFAQHYAVIRSVIDTTIKNSKNIFEALTERANQKLTAE